MLHWLYKENWAVREGPWKLIGQDDEVLLANLASDPGETIDHRDSHPSVEQRLVGLHNRFILELGKDPNVAAQSPGATG